LLNKTYWNQITLRINLFFFYNIYKGKALITFFFIHQTKKFLKIKRKSMACKCIKNLMVVMIKLFIIILLKVQANDLANIPFHPSAPLTLVLHFPKLDKVQTNDLASTTCCPSPMPIPHTPSSEHDEVQRTIHTCFDNEIKVCEKKWPLHEFFKNHLENFIECSIVGHAKCWSNRHTKEVMTPKHLSCVIDCVKYRTDVATCFKECYERHIEKHSDVVYAQNP
jgi:hypothetical protein